MMAHELAHVQNRDTLTMTITATLAGAISMLGNFAFFFGGNRDNNNPLGFVGVLVAMIVAPLAAMLVQMAISRTREYAADRRGAEICGNPLWLASALDKIARGAERIHNPRCRAQPGDRAISSSSTRCPASAWTICSPPIPTPRTASPRWRRWRARWVGRPKPSRTAHRGRSAARRRAAAIGPVGQVGAARSSRPSQPPEANPWGRNPTGPKGPWS